MGQTRLRASVQRDHFAGRRRLRFRLYAWQGERVVTLHPPLEGEGRLTLSAAKCEPGWGDLSTRALFVTRDCHPTPPLISFASTLPLQGRVSLHAAAGTTRERDSLLPERAHQLVAERLDQVGQHGAVAGLH